jgi:AAHS family 4-hydroxybenzoate transporter-like MFS transporter
MVTVNVSKLVDHSRLGVFQITVFILCGFCLIMDGFDVQSMGYVGPTLIPEWKITPQTWGTVLSAAPMGVLIGSLLFSMIADKVGRRPVLIGVTAYYGILTLITAQATSANQLFWIRLIAGIGLGGIMPNGVALSGEYSPQKSRVTVMMVVANCFSAGAALGGFVAAWLIPHFGWRSVFYFGGSVPLAISAAMLVLLPESLQFLAATGRSMAGAVKWIRKLDPSAPAGPGVEYTTSEQRQKGVPFIRLFYEGRAMGTVLIWILNFMNLLNLYFLANWLPTVVANSGFTRQQGVLVTAMLQLAGTAGAFVLGWLVHKLGFVPVLATGFLMGTVCIALIGQPGISLAAMFIVVSLAGVGVVGGQAGVNAFSATFYPTELRSTGVGAGLGIGRIGAIVGPMVAGQLLGLHWTTGRLFYAAAVPALISAIVMIVLRWAARPQAPQQVAGEVVAH